MSPLQSHPCESCQRKRLGEAEEEKTACSTPSSTSQREQKQEHIVDSDDDSDSEHLEGENIEENAEIPVLQEYADPEENAEISVLQEDADPEENSEVSVLQDQLSDSDSEALSNLRDEVSNEIPSSSQYKEHRALRALRDYNNPGSKENTSFFYSKGKKRSR